MVEKSKVSCLLAVRLRGTVGDSPEIRKTLESLALESTFRARLLPDNPSIAGMLRKAKHIVAWGEVDQPTLEVLLRKRGERELRSQALDDGFVKERFGKDGLMELAGAVVAGEVGLEDLWRAGLKPRFRLHPPRGGFKRSTRRAFSDGGELGYRGAEINSLVRRMA